MGVPFLFTVSVCLGCMMAENCRRRSALTAGAAVFSAALVLAAAAVPQIYLPSAAAVWCMVLAAGAAVLSVQIRRLFNEMLKLRMKAMSRRIGFQNINRPFARRDRRAQALVSVYTVRCRLASGISSVSARP